MSTYTGQGFRAPNLTYNAKAMSLHEQCLCRYDKKDQWSSSGDVTVENYLLLDSSTGAAVEHLSKAKAFLHKRGLI